MTDKAASLPAAQPEAAAPPPHRADAPSDDRLAVLSGDRLCASCCFNLSGQQVVRERHYGLLIVRCPECGTPAALQEYPALGRWAGRLGIFIAGAWSLAMLGLVALTALAIYLLSSATTSYLVRPYAEHINGEWAKHQAALTAQGPQQQSRYYGFDTQWWETVDHAAAFEAAGGWGAGIGWYGLWTWAFALLSVIPLGAVWAVVAPHARRGRMLLIALLCAAVGTGFLAVEFYGNTAAWGWYSSQDAAYHQIGLPLHALSLGFCLISLFLGMLVGRILARGLVRLFIPPRLRAPLSFLWLADGLPLPRRA